MTNLVGQSLGRYHILEQLGEGGMAVVYKAYDTRLEREVAIKVIRTERLTLENTPKALKRFEREAKSLGKLTHPNIVPVSDYGEYDGKPFLVMPYLSGGTLKARLGKPMQWQEAVGILIPIGRALAYAHKQDIIHRDIKPANILITIEGEPMLSDFGVAKILDAEETLELTGTGIGIGTPEYMAPEQGNSKTIDHRADIYSLGVVFYEMVTGRKPYTADTPLAVLIKRASEPLPRPRQFAADLSHGVENVLFKALAKDPKDRYQSMGEFVHALERLAAGKTIPDQLMQGKLSTSPGKTLITITLAVTTVGVIAFLLKPISTFSAQVFATSTPSSTPTSTNTPTPASTNTPTFTITPMSTTTPELAIGSTLVNKDGMVMMYVPAGEFIMGSSLGPSNEQPSHPVTLDGYWMDQTEVTNGMYAKCVDAAKCKPPENVDHFTDPKYANHPVVYVDYYQGMAYCSWAGRGLPTEAQWEKAARGPDERTYPWGEEIDCGKANYYKCVGDTTEVSKYDIGKSPYGVYNMSGNVWELVDGFYSETYYESSIAILPLLLGSYSHVLRGGSYSDDKSQIRTAFRANLGSTFGGANIGFRCALTP